MPGERMQKGEQFFPDTPKTLLAELKAAQGDAIAQRELLWQFLELYIPAITAYIQRLVDRGRSIGNQEVDDAVHDFLRDKVISRNIITEVWMQPDGGRLRFFLTTSIRNHMIDMYRRRRIHEVPTLSMTTLTPEELERALSQRGEDGLNAAELFDLEWARSIAAEGIARARDYLIVSGQELVWYLYKRYRLAPVFQGMGEPASMDVLLKETSLTKPKFHSHITNGQRAVQKSIRHVVGRYAPESKLQAETDYIVGLLTSGMRT